MNMGFTEGHHRDESITNAGWMFFAMKLKIARKVLRFLVLS